MTTLQIVLLSVAGAFAFISLIFMIMFIAEISVRKKKKRSDEIEVKSIFSSENYVSSVREEPKLDSISSMLAKLDEQAAVAAKVEPVKIEEIEKVVVQEEVVEPFVEEIAESPAEVIEETKLEDSKAEETIQVVETTEEGVEEVVEETTEESVEVSEPVDETTKDVAEEVEEVVEETEEFDDESVEEAQEESTAEVDGVKVEEISGETISIESLPDYQSRLDKIIENRDKLNKDLIKIEKSILNYERTKRRKLRNQKMLDRRASELTNLNLIMYSVTDIKNVDEDKKIKQEELTSHIAELKASIQDAEEFLDSNKEKNEHDVKMAKFLIQEKARFNEEIVELQKLIATIDGASE